MKQTRATLRYAKSLFSLAIEQNTLESCKQDMQFIADTCANSKDLALLLKNPIIKTDKKIAIFKAIFYDNLSEICISFVNIITSKRREPLLEGIANSFITLYKAHKNIETASVSTAIELDESLRLEILDYIKSQGKLDIELTEVVDKNLIGGAVIRIGNRQLDVSVVKAIKDLKKSFSKNLYIKDF